MSQEEAKEINLRLRDDSMDAECPSCKTKFQIPIKGGGGYAWDKEVTKDVEINDVISNIIKKQFQKLDREERLQEDHLDLYMKFTQGEMAS